MATNARADSADPSDASSGDDSLHSAAFAGIVPVLGRTGRTESEVFGSLASALTALGSCCLSSSLVSLAAQGLRSLWSSLASVTAEKPLTLVSEVAMSRRVSLLVDVLMAENWNDAALALAGWTALKSHESVLMKAPASSAAFLSTRTLPICNPGLMLPKKARREVSYSLAIGALETAQT
ncbi:hypothetical protein PHYPSEUDO_013933 [Phytophthora pseudosyringae]|uniref:Uncharacterized protein n=1 Tax=Phytophthora pseudosyringae TaxID=221518 RepID=A0A8T1V7D4_9STRA|nr:hypothetical protein PHYPSEUDO_013933 [Phytophthora pseudosyringae]